MGQLLNLAIMLLAGRQRQKSSRKTKKKGLGAGGLRGAGQRQQLRAASGVRTAVARRAAVVVSRSLFPGLRGIALIDFFYTALY
jgi:hypothetical protein